jgi:hypothetical protein
MLLNKKNRRLNEELCLSKHKNGYYYIYYKDDNGKPQSITTKTKVKSEVLKAVSRQFHIRPGQIQLLGNDRYQTTEIYTHLRIDDF